MTSGQGGVFAVHLPQFPFDSLHTLVAVFWRKGDTFLDDPFEIRAKAAVLHRSVIGTSAAHIKECLAKSVHITLNVALRIAVSLRCNVGGRADEQRVMLLTVFVHAGGVTVYEIELSILGTYHKILRLDVAVDDRWHLLMQQGDDPAKLKRILQNRNIGLLTGVLVSGL